jgi:antitoxin protein of toxin-antitoxin system
MPIVDKVKELLGQHGDKAERGIDKAGDMINDKTGGKYRDKVETAEQKAKDMLGQDSRRGGRPGGRPGDDDMPGPGARPGQGG